MSYAGDHNPRTPRQLPLRSSFAIPARKASGHFTLSTLLFVSSGLLVLCLAVLLMR